MNYDANRFFLVLSPQDQMRMRLKVSKVTCAFCLFSLVLLYSNAKHLPADDQRQKTGHVDFPSNTAK